MSEARYASIRWCFLKSATLSQVAQKWPRDSDSAAAAAAATARSTATTHPAAPTASPSSTPSPTLTTDADGVRHREAGPFIELEVLSQLQVSFRTAITRARTDPARRSPR